MRVGMGYDVHKLVEGRDLILGGVTVPHTLGLLGHSDADVLVHASWMRCSARRHWEISENIFRIQTHSMREFRA